VGEGAPKTVQGIGLQQGLADGVAQGGQGEGEELKKAPREEEGAEAGADQKGGGDGDEDVQAQGGRPAKASGRTPEPPVRGKATT